MQFCGPATPRTGGPSWSRQAHPSLVGVHGGRTTGVHIIAPAGPHVSLFPSVVLAGGCVLPHHRECGTSLFSKVSSRGLSLFAVISKFHSGRSICVVVDCYLSTPKPISRGVPQGTVLSFTFLPLIDDEKKVFCSRTPVPIRCFTQHVLTQSLPELQDSSLIAIERLTYQPCHHSCMRQQEFGDKWFKK